MFFKRVIYLEIEISITFLYEKEFEQMTPFSKEMMGALEFDFSDVLQSISANAISRHMFFKRGIYWEIEISITFLYEKQF